MYLAISTFALIITSVFLISFHAPIATSRNFIVLAPISAVVIGVFISEVSSSSRRNFYNVSTVAVLHVTLSIYLAYDRTEIKQAPFENWRDTAIEASIQSKRHDAALYHYIAGDTADFMASWRDLVFNFYLPPNLKAIDRHWKVYCR